MIITEILNKFIELGYSYKNSQNLAAEEIIINKIANSPFCENITLKGGIVMYNLTNNNRRVTQDIDFDLIRYSIENESLILFVKSLNDCNDGISAFIDGKIERLHQEDYQGSRVRLILKDKNDNTLKIKLDIGVHKYLSIKQERILFALESYGSNVSMMVNSCEQIFVEKLLSLARLGPISKRYKDLYDMYYLLERKALDKNRVIEYLNVFFTYSKRKPNSLSELINSIVKTLNDNVFKKEASRPASNWLEVDYQQVKDEIINYISNLS